MSAQGKEIIIQPLVPSSQLEGFISEVVGEGVKSFLCETPISIGKLAGRVKVISPSKEGDVMLVSSIRELEAADAYEKPKALYVTIRKREDVEAAIQGVRRGAQYLMVEAEDWRIIPLENLIAELHKSGVKIYAKVDTPEEIETMFGVLELGVDGVILPVKSVEDVKKAQAAVSTITEISLCPAKVVEVRDVGMGERVCIDTASILEMGEGVLVGSRANFLFLVHNESVGSQFTSPRPFRVNAGSIHSYVLLPNGRTKYLSEVEGGDKVLIVGQKGRARVAVVGRVKIERRPLKLVKAEYGGEIGSIIVQNAETIRFVGGKDQILPVTEMKMGDEILTTVKPATGRHFGAEVDEFIIEK